MRVKFRVIGAILLASLVVATVADEETLSGADSNTISVLDPRKLTRSSSNINAAAINSLTGSSPSADGKSNETTLIFATHVTEPDAPQLETHPELNNQLGQTVYLQAQPPQHGQHHHQQGPPPQPQHQHHHAGQFLYPQPAPVQPTGLGHQGAPLNAPGASPPYLYNPGYGVQYVQYVPRPVAMTNYPSPPSVYGQHPSQFSNVPSLLPSGSHHHSHNYHSHIPAFPQSSPYILPPPPAHHTFPSSINNYNSPQNGPLHQTQSSQSQPQTSPHHQHHHHQHHPQTHFLAGPSPQSQPVAPASTYASGSAVGPHPAQSQQPQLHSHQAQATSQPSSYLTYSSPSHHYHSSQPQVHHHHITHQTPSPTAQATSLVPSHVQPPQQQSLHHQQQQQLSLQGQQQQQQLIGSYSHQAPLYSYVHPQQQGVRYGGPSDPFLNTNEYLPQTQYDPTQYRPIKRNSKA